MRQYIGARYTIKIYKNSLGQKLRFYDFSNCVFSYSPCAPITHENFIFVWHCRAMALLRIHPPHIAK